MVTKLTQTQSGGKYDGQVREKKRSKKGKRQKGYTIERFMPVIMLIFQIKRINLRPPPQNPCGFFFLFFKNSKKLGLKQEVLPLI